MSHREITLLSAARRAVAEARSLDELKHIRDKAEALRAYAKQRGESLALQNEAAEIKLRAERRAGELLAGMPKQHGARGVPSCNPAQRLSDIGIGKAQAHRWQREAAVPDAAFESYVAAEKAAAHELTTAGVLPLGMEARKAAKGRAKATAPPDLPAGTDRYAVLHGDFRTAAVEAASIDWIITDPPYPRDALPLYEALARFGARVLKPGGGLLAMVGQSYLPEILALMTPHIRYRWTLAYLTPGGQAVQLWDRKINTFWKPVLCFAQGDIPDDWAGDVCRSAVNDNDKRHHGWGQSESGMRDIIERFTYPGQRICDPCCGGGTTGVVALALDRFFLGIDVDPDAVARTLSRLGAIAA